jgi:hypothetical protein
MKTAATANHEQTLRAIFRKLDPAKAQEIREAYYKAVEGLQVLMTALEAADDGAEGNENPLLDEHYLACRAKDEMNKSLLARIL